MPNKVVYALVAGCTVIMKPSPETPLEAYIIAEAAEAAGLPAGVVNLVCGQREATDHLVRNPGVDKVSFTGSTAAGKRIASVCGERIARCTLELGGKSAAIVRDDFPIEAAAGSSGNDHGDERAGLRDAEPRDRSAAPPRRAGRGDRARDEAGHDRPFRRSARPSSARWR